MVGHDPLTALSALNRRGQPCTPDLARFLGGDRSPAATCRQVAHRGAFLSQRERTSPLNHARSASGLTEVGLLCTTHGPPGCLTLSHMPLLLRSEGTPTPTALGTAPPAPALKTGTSESRRRSRHDLSRASADVIPAECLSAPTLLGENYEP